MSRMVYLNGDFVPEAEAKVSVFDRGFLFADAVYEVTPVIDGNLVDNAGHMVRLARSLRELAIPEPMPMEEIEAAMLETVRRNGVSEGAIYLQITRGSRGSPSPARWINSSPRRPGIAAR